MTLAWTPEMKQTAKDEGKALVKFQAQLKHCNGGPNLSIVGPFSEKRALAMFLIGCLRDGDEKIQQVLDLLQPQTER